MRAAHILTIGGLLLLGGIASVAGGGTEQFIDDELAAPKRDRPA